MLLYLQAIQQLDMIVQQNAAASEQLAATSHTLSDQAAELKEIMTYFSLSSAGIAGGPHALHGVEWAPANDCDAAE